MEKRSLKALRRATITSTQSDFRKYRLRQRDAWRRGQDLDADLLLIQKYIQRVAKVGKSIAKSMGAEQRQT
eukprot:1856144-Pleurochrysis_carterae.AAC.3